MELSLFLAKLMGLYLVLVSLAFWLNRRVVAKLIAELSGNVSLTIFSGAMLVILGLAVVLKHNVWVADWRVIVTILGWITLLKGLLRTFAPEKVPKLAVKSESALTVIFLIALALGAYLTYIGFTL